jgi:hypothetical protein
MSDLFHEKVSFSYIERVLPLVPSVSRRTIDLVAGYSKANTSPILTLFLSGLRTAGAHARKKELNA